MSHVKTVEFSCSDRNLFKNWEIQNGSCYAQVGNGLGGVDI